MVGIRLTAWASARALDNGVFSLTYVHANIGPFDKLTLGCDPLYKRSTGK